MEPGHAGKVGVEGVTIMDAAAQQVSRADVVKVRVAIERHAQKEWQADEEKNGQRAAHDPGRNSPCRRCFSRKWFNGQRRLKGGGRHEQALRVSCNTGENISCKHSTQRKARSLAHPKMGKRALESRVLSSFWDGPLLRPFADVEFQFPAFLAVGAQAGQFQGANLRYLAVQVDRHHLPAFALPVKRRGQRAQFLDLSLPVLDHRAHRVIAANRGRQETKLRRGTNNETEFLLR